MSLTPAQQSQAGPDTGQPVLSLSGLTVRLPSERGTLEILNGVDLTLERGEALGIVGESGSGKSMTAMAILGLVPHSATITGAISLDGDDLVSAPASTLQSLRGSKIGTILQDPNASLNPSLRIGRQVGEPLQIHQGLGRRDALDRAGALLDEVGIQDPLNRVRDYPHQFSGGMRQRIVGAAAIACGPQLLIADEPTTALDVTVQAEYLDLLERLKEDADAALMLITHDMAVVARLCSKIAVMYAGRIIETGSVDEILHGARHPYTIGLLGCLPQPGTPKEELVPIAGNPPDPAKMPTGCPFAPRCPARTTACESSPPPLMEVSEDGGHRAACIRLDQHFSLHDLWPRKPITEPARETSAEDQQSLRAAVDAERSAPKPVLSLAGVSREFVRRRDALGRASEHFLAVDSVNLDVYSGRTLAVVGESGSGKTTCAKMALGLDRPTSGTVLFEGQDIYSANAKTHRAYRRRVQAVFQDPFTSFDPRMPLGQAVAEPLVELGERMHRDAVQERVTHLLEQVGLDPARILRAYPHQLSGGQRQRVAIARAMITSPDVIVLDEPVSALDVSIRAQVMNVLREIQQATGVGFMIISHDLAAVRYLSTDIAVMFRGRLLECGTADQVYGNPAHPYTRQLLDDAALKRRGQPVTASGAAGRALSERCSHDLRDGTRVRAELVDIDHGHRVACHVYGT